MASVIDNTILEREHSSGSRLSPPQRRLWSLQRDAAATFRAQALVRIVGALDTERVAASLRLLVQRHELLRTRFAQLAGMDFPVQAVDGEQFAAAWIAQLELPHAADETLLWSRLRTPEESHATILYALSEPTPGECLLGLSLPSLYVDRAGLVLLIEELFTTYAALEQDMPASESDLIPYSDLSEWLNESLESEERAAGRAHWTRVGEALPPVIPFERTLRSSAGAELLTHELSVTHSLALHLMQAARSNAQSNDMPSVAAMLLAAWQCLLRRVSEQSRFTVHVVGHGREHEELRDVPGPLSRLLPITVELDVEATFAAVATRAEHALTEAMAWQEYFDPAELPEASVGFEFHELPAARELGVRTLSITRLQARLDDCKLQLRCARQGERVQLWLDYDARRIPAAYVATLAEQYLALLTSALRDPTTGILQLELMDASQRAQLLAVSDSTPVTPLECWHRRFEQQAARSAQQVAVLCGAQQVSYADLNAAANQLARYLQERGAGPGTMIGICLQRTPQMVIALLAVAKAGAAYVPLDTSHPPERLRYMIEDSGITQVITQRALAERLDGSVAGIIDMDAEQQRIASQPTSNLTNVVQLHDPVYAIYTSGSTGRPKAALIEHGALANYLEWALQAYPVTADGPIPVASPLGFDATITSLFPGLLAGRTLLLLPQEQELDELASLLLAGRPLGLVKITPAHLEALEHLIKDTPVPVAPAAFVIGGEALLGSTVQYWQRKVPQTRLFNEYGPTETVVGCCVYEVVPGAPVAAAVPIGRPIANMQLHVLDAHLQPVPVGVTGEIYIGGAGVGRGYLNRAELTQQRFIADPFSKVPGARMYRSGDLARRTPEGILEYLGRADEQIKLHGYRIEPGEIEVLLRYCPGVAESAVLLDGEPGTAQRLVAFIRPEEAMPEEDKLRSHLAAQLPSYMLPSLWVSVSNIPLTANGKVDRRALLQQLAQVGVRPSYVPPRNQLEQLLAQAWSEVLGVERVGADDRFFELGGDSIRAIQLRSRLRQVDLEISLQQMFQHQRLRDMAAITTPRSETHSESIPRSSHAGPHPLSFAQQRLWFLQQLTPENAYYNVPWVAYVDGPLDVDVMRRSLTEIMARHGTLRTTIVTVKREPMQVVAAPSDAQLCIEDLSEHEPRQRAAKLAQLVEIEASTPFDLTQGTFRCRLVRLGAESHLLLLTLHHIVTDGWSNNILMQEMAALYTAFSAGQPSPLPSLPVQYTDFAEWQRRRLTGALEARQIEYWKEQLRDPPLLLQLPTDHPRPLMQSFRGAAARVQISSEVTAQLRSLGERAGTTLFMTLLAGFATLLFRYGRQRDMIIGTPTANRTHKDIEPLIGFFVNTLALRVRPEGELTFEQLLAQVRETTVQAYDHQEVPFERLVDELRLERDMSRNPLIQTTFVLQNLRSTVVELPQLTLRPYGEEISAVRFDLEVHMFEEGDGLGGYFVYCTDLFEAATMERFAAHFQRLLAEVAAHPDMQIARVPLLDDEERQQLLSTWNETREDYAREISAQQLFEAQVAQAPGAIAIEHGTRLMTFAELNQRANQLAHVLRSAGAGPDVPIGVCLERNPDLLVALLGVWKAGAAYVPLDPAHSSERLRYMLEDAGATILLTQATLAAHFDAFAGTVHCLDRDWERFASAPQVNPPPASATQLAYIIYTSGSTGRPKGVAIEHRGLVNYLSWAVRRYAVAEGLGAPVHSSISFDATITSLFAPLMAGRRVILLGARDEVAGLAAALSSERSFSLIKITPAHLELLAHVPELRGVRPQTFVIGGEALLGSTLTAWSQRFPGSRFINEYGPTETVVGCCIHEVRAGEQIEGPVPIGRPIANTQLYVLDEHMQPVPVGVAGELYIGGDGVARGYWRQPELTHEKFIPDPFSGVAGARLYRTGDLARYRRDGTLEFLGRIDNQMKLRGYRIEPGEVEAALRAHPGVVEALVTLREDRPGDKRLVAYVTATRPTVAAGMQAAGLLVRQWEQVFQDTYGSAAVQEQIGSFAGRNSSYTGLPIAEAEMQEWRAATCARIASLQPCHVLEIGCGTGLILGAIAPSCASYVGIDFSSEALRHAERLVAHAGLTGVRLLQAPAHELPKVTPPPDTIVLNSVVEYFPNSDYLRYVLRNAVAALGSQGSSQGRIFIGDVRDLGLLEMMHASVQSVRSAGRLTPAELRNRVRERVAADKELAIHPAWFQQLSAELPIARAQVLLKRGRHGNELTKFRYDVVLHIGTAPGTNALTERREWSAETWSLEQIRAALVCGFENGCDALQIDNVRNARLSEELRLLEGARDEELGQLGLDPEQLWELGEELGLNVEITRAAQAERFNVLFSRDATMVAAPVAYAAEVLANDPLQTALDHRLAAELRAFARQRLPTFMVPAQFVVMQALPLTHNGKVDRDRLPVPLETTGRGRADATPPRTATERIIAQAWADVLGMDEVGIEDDFFELGGHSLLTTQVLSRIREAFHVSLPLVAIFERPTVAALAALVDNALAGVVDVAAQDATTDLAAEAVLAHDIEPLQAAPPIEDPQTARAILLTGGSGFLGAYLVRELLDSTDAQLYCLVRADSERVGVERIQANLTKHGLWQESLRARIVAVCGDLEAPQLGLDAARWQELAQAIDLIYHNGALVNFTAPYARLKAANVLGTQEVIRLASSVRRKPLHLVSTISVFPAATDARTQALEADPLTSPEGLSNGYSQSKWVAEHLVRAAQQRGLPVAIYRPGTITGDPERGTCNPDDLAFRMIRGCLRLGLAPDVEALVGFVPVDYVSRAIVYLSLLRAPSHVEFHIVNPRYRNVHELIDMIRACGYRIATTSYGEWRAALLADVRSSVDNALYPFASSFGEEVGSERELHFDCRHTLELLAGSGIACPDMSRELIDVYLRYLASCGLLPEPSTRVAS